MNTIFSIGLHQKNHAEEWERYIVRYQDCRRLKKWLLSFAVVALDLAELGSLSLPRSTCLQSSAAIVQRREREK